MKIWYNSATTHNFTYKFTEIFCIECLYRNWYRQVRSWSVPSATYQAALTYWRSTMSAVQTLHHCSSVSAEQSTSILGGLLHGAETAAVERLLPPPTQNILFQSVYTDSRGRADGSVMRPRSFSRRCNINALVTVTVTVTPVSDIASRQHLRSTSRHQLFTIPRHWRSIFGHRTFSVANPMTWKSLPDSLWDPARSSDCFRWDFKTCLPHLISVHSALEA